MPTQTQGPNPDSNTMVECRTDRSSCGGSSVPSAMKDCCDHDIEPSGLAYTIPGDETCQLCPVGKIIILDILVTSILNLKLLV